MEILNEWKAYSCLMYFLNKQHNKSAAQNTAWTSWKQTEYRLKMERGFISVLQSHLSQNLSVFMWLHSSAGSLLLWTCCICVAELNRVMGLLVMLLIYSQETPPPPPPPPPPPDIPQRFQLPELCRHDSGKTNKQNKQMRTYKLIRTVNVAVGWKERNEK